MYDFEVSREIYAKLKDDTSRFIYEKRCMYSLTGDIGYVNDIIESLIDRQQLNSLIDKAKNVSDKLVIRGTGNEFHTLMRLCPDLEWEFFVDRDAMRVSAGEFFEHKVISVDRFYEEFKDRYVLICSSAFCKDIENELREHGIAEEQIITFGELLNCNQQYFDNDIIRPVEHEVFVDGGCFDGTTVRNFVAWSNRIYDEIYSYEPDHINYERTLTDMSNNPVKNLHLYNKGLWNKSDKLYFYESGGQGSGIVSDDNEDTEVVPIETVSIDETVGDSKVTFIKLDVEGAEYEALQGAITTIQRYHPRMAISIYHKPEDIFTIPRFVMEMSDDYTFYLRHYQMSDCETILYAI